MVDIKTAIDELNNGKIEFKCNTDDCCTTEGEIVILLKRLDELEKSIENMVELPLIAMIEQDIINGKFAQGKKYQNNNGRYAVVYTDKKKWGVPLIDICGEYAYNTDEAIARLKELQK